jgi:single-strand DNA-binding protein
MSVNKVILIGNVGKDPEVRYLDNNVAVASFPLATTERGYTTRDGQVIPDRTEWHNITVWRGLAQVAEKYVKKGTQLYVEGKLRTRSYEDKDGVKKYFTEVYTENLQLLGRKGDSTTDSSSGSGFQEASQPVNNSTPQNNLSGTPSEGSADISADDETDDLPF